LVGQGHYVRSLVRKGSQPDFLKSIGVEIVYGDLSEPATLSPAVRGLDIVYHIAGLFRQQSIDPKMFRKVNTEAVEHLLASSVQYGVRRFVHCSTIGVHGHISHPPATEDSRYSPGDIYQESKLEGEKIAQQYMKEGEIAVTIIRPTSMYGPRDLRFLKLFRAIKKRRFIMLGSGEVTCHLVYIDDLMDGIILCGTQERAIGNIYILGGEGYVTLDRLATMIAEELEVPPPRLHLPLWPVYVAGFLCEALCKPLRIEPPLYRRRIDFFRNSRAFDISKAKRELGFEPKTDLRTGIRLTAAWYRKEGLL
jgi:nucleoside-diphosphate-sugar epimerase